MATIPDFLQNLIQTGKSDVSNAAKTVMNAINQPKQRTKQTGAVSTDASNLAQTFLAPFQAVGHQALPNVIPASTPQQDQQAQQGAEFGMGAIQGNPEADALAPSIDVGLDTAKTVGQAAIQRGEQVVKDVAQAAQAQHGGFQAGFLGLGGNEDTTTGMDLTDNATAQKAIAQRGKNGNPVQNIDLTKKYGLYSPDHEKAVQQTLNTEVPGFNPIEVLDALPQTMTRLGNKIKSIIADNPSTVTPDHPDGITMQDIADGVTQKARNKNIDTNNPAVKAEIAKNTNYAYQVASSPEGNIPAGAPTVFNPDLSPVDMNSATIKGNPASDTIQYRRAGGVKPGSKGPPGYLVKTTVKNGETPNVAAQPSTPYNPSQMASTNQKDVLAQQPLTKQHLYDQLTSLNSRNADVLQDRAEGQPLTDVEKAGLLVRDSVKDLLKKAAPEASQLISKQSNLYDAVPSVSKARAKYLTSGNIITNQPGWAKVAEALGIPFLGYEGLKTVAHNADTFYNYLTGSSGGAMPTITFSGTKIVAGKNGSVTLPDPNTIKGNVQPAIIPNSPNVYKNGIYPYQVNQLQNEYNARLTNPLNNPKIQTPDAVQYQSITDNLAKEIDSDNAKISTDINNYKAQNPSNDKMIDNMKADASAIKGVVSALQSGNALPGNNVAALKNEGASEDSMNAKYSSYGQMYSDIKNLENDGVIPEGTVTKGMTKAQATKRFLAALTTNYYPKLALYQKNYRMTPDYGIPQQQAGQTNGIQTGNPQLNAVLNIPTPSPVQPSPTNTPFQNTLLNSSQGKLNNPGGGGYTSSTLLNNILAQAH